MIKFKFLTLCSILSVLICFQSCDALPEFFLKNDSSSSSACGDTLTLLSSVYLKSQVGAGLYGGLNTYEANEDCETTFIAETEFQILVQFPYINLQEPSGNTCVDKLQLQENITTAENGTTETTYINVTHTNVTQWCNGTVGVNETCWNVTSNYTETVAENSTQSQLNTTTICENPEPSTCITNSLTIKFLSDGSIQGGGFVILLTAYRTAPCNETNEFLCDTNRCISKNLTCDGINHCLDTSDETKENASCRDTSGNDTDSTTGLGKNAVLGIAVVSAGIVCTIVIVIIMSQFMDRESNSCCKSNCRRASDDDVESHTSVKIVRIRKIVSGDVPSKLLKQKKSVIIAGENEDNDKSKKSKRIRKVAPSTLTDDEW